MTGSRRQRSRRTASQLWWRNGLVWVVLMALLFTSLVLAYIPMGFVTPASGIVVAFIKASLVVLLYMELARSRVVDRLAAVGGLLFLIVMFTITMTDVLWRVAAK